MQRVEGEESINQAARRADGSLRGCHALANIAGLFSSKRPEASTWHPKEVAGIPTGPPFKLPASMVSRSHLKKGCHDTQAPFRSALPLNPTTYAGRHCLLEKQLF